jgi:hypothetical protein
MGSLTGTAVCLSLSVCHREREKNEEGRRRLLQLESAASQNKEQDALRKATLVTVYLSLAA